MTTRGAPGPMDRQLFAQRRQNALFLRQLIWIALQSRGDQRARKQRRGDAFVEFRQPSETQRRRHLVQNVGRADDLDLPGHRLTLRIGGAAADLPASSDSRVSAR